MSQSLNLAHYADLLNQLNAWVCTYPMTTAFPEGEYLKGLVIMKKL